MNFNLEEFVDFRTKKKVDACVRSVVASMEHENTVMAGTPNGLFQRLLKVFVTLRPLLAFLTSFPLIPPLWRTGLGVLVQVLESMAAIGADVTVQFKAGKDL